MNKLMLSLWRASANEMAAATGKQKANEEEGGKFSLLGTAR